MSEITVVVADAERLFAEALGESLAREPSINVVAVRFGPGHGALDAIISIQPDVVVYDFWTPGASGPAAARYLGAWAPSSRVLLLSWLHGPFQVRESFDAGAAGMIAKKVSLVQLVEAIRDAEAGRALRCAEPVTPMVARAGPEHDQSPCWAKLKKLTLRELEVLHLLSLGRTVPDVAYGMGLARSTAKNHVHNILTKMATASTAEAIDLAQHEGLLSS